MTYFEIRLRAGAPDHLDDEATTRFHEELDGLLAWHGGVLFITVGLSTANPGAAARHVVERVENLLNVRIAEATLDLVDIPEIADRINRTRQNVQQLVSGVRRPDESATFPQPLDVVRGKRIWDWGTVAHWLAQHQMLDAAEPLPLGREQIYVLNAWIARRTQFSTRQLLHIEFPEITYDFDAKSAGLPTPILSSFSMTSRLELATATQAPSLSKAS